MPRFHLRRQRGAAVGPVGLIVLVLAASAACSSGGQESSPSTTDQQEAAPGAGTAPPTSIDDVEVPRSGSRLVAEEIDAAAERRCDRYGYPCGWAEADDEAWERSLALLEEASSMLAEGSDPLAERLERTAEMLISQPDVVEVEPEIESLAGITFRVAGAPEVVVLTDAAWPGGDDPATALGDEELFVDLEVLGVEPATFPDEAGGDEAPGDVLPGDEEGDADAADSDQSGPVGFAGRSRPGAFDPTFGPLQEPRRALIIDPYHGVDAQWREGDEVAALFRSHPDFEMVVHLRDAVSHDDLTSFSNFDAVHVVSHGYTRCPRDADGDIIADGSRCSSGFGLGVIPSGFDRSTLPNGVTVLNSSVDGNNRQFVFDSFFADQGGSQNLDETVVMFSTCQGAGLGSGFSGSQGTLLSEDLQTPMMGLFGSALAWDQNVTLRVGASASLAFWSLMVEEGVDAELAYRQLQDAGLDVSGERNDLLDDFVDFIQENPPAAELRYAGDDKRVRDVIETRYEGSELARGAKIQIDGVPGDGANDRIEELQFFVEAVADDELAATEIKLLLDDRELPEVINLAGNSERIGGGNGFGHYLVTVEDVDLGVDITRGDVDPTDLTDFRLEARVSSDGFGQYSAHEADPVHFAADLTARGPIPIMTELADAVRPAGTLEGNELAITFNTAGGEATGEYLATISASGIEIGYWSLILDGTYDPETGEMSGTIIGEAFGSVAGITAGDQGEGVWQGRVDVRAGVLQATLGIGGSSQPYRGEF